MQPRLITTFPSGSTGSQAYGWPSNFAQDPNVNGTSAVWGSSAVPGTVPRPGAARRCLPAAFRWQTHISRSRSTGKIKPHTSAVCPAQRDRWSSGGPRRSPWASSTTSCSPRSTPAAPCTAGLCLTSPSHLTVGPAPLWCRTPSTGLRPRHPAISYVSSALTLAASRKA
jgi:hypothetical protein